MSISHRTVSVLSSLAILALASTAHADESRNQQQGIVGEAQRWLTAATAGPTVASEPTRGGVGKETSTTAERLAPKTTDADKPFVDFSSPNLALVARDWRGSLKLVGHRTMLVDDLRPTASNRLVVARLATDARLSTFVQVGVGEWRIDPAMFPSVGSYSEMAGQLGMGFDLRLPHGLRVAGEAQYTALYRDLHYTPDEVAPRILAFVVAIDGRF